jgi:uncharacterized RDD family membrane protein YckC
MNRSIAFASLSLLAALVVNGGAVANAAQGTADTQHAAGTPHATNNPHATDTQHAADAQQAADPPGGTGAASSAEWPEGAGSHGHGDSQDHADSQGHTDSEDDADSEDHADSRTEDDGRKHSSRRHDHGNSVVNIGRNSDLPAGESADAVVAIFGSSSSEGQARDVVSIAGSTRVTGPVGDSAVAVLGDTYVDSRVSGDVVAVLGNVELGPHAEVQGDVVAVGGAVTRDAAASVHGSVQSVGGVAMSFAWLRPWIKHCLLYGRPLALVSGVGWAWGVALALLVLYACLALLFRDGVKQCVGTLERQPGMVLVAALLAALLTPILLVLLCITVLGIAAVPFVVFGLFCAALFGKTVMLAWVGGRCIGAHRTGALGHPAFAVLVGGGIVLTLYLVPIVGFLVYKLLGLFGFGAVVYTVIGGVRTRRAAAVGAPSSGGATAAGAGVTSAASAMAATSAAAPSAAPGAVPPASSGAEPSAATAGTAPAGEPFVASAGAATAGAAPLITAALPRAGFWIRMAALLLDALLVGFLFGMVLHAGHLHLLALGVYGAVMWKLRGSTIGGIVFDLQVVRLDGRAIDWQTAIVRALGCFLSLAVAGLGFFWIAFDAGKQGWHDKIAGTAVVRVPRGVPRV